MDDTHIASPGVLDGARVAGRTLWTLLGAIYSLVGVLAYYCTQASILLLGFVAARLYKQHADTDPSDDPDVDSDPDPDPDSDSDPDSDPDVYVGAVSERPLCGRGFLSDDDEKDTVRRRRVQAPATPSRSRSASPESAGVATPAGSAYSAASLSDDRRLSAFMASASAEGATGGVLEQPIPSEDEIEFACAKANAAAPSVHAVPSAHDARGHRHTLSYSYSAAPMDISVEPTILKKRRHSDDLASSSRDWNARRRSSEALFERASLSRSGSTGSGSGIPTRDPSSSSHTAPTRKSARKGSQEKIGFFSLLVEEQDVPQDTAPQGLHKRWEGHDSPRKELAHGDGTKGSLNKTEEHDEESESDSSRAEDAFLAELRRSQEMRMLGKEDADANSEHLSTMVEPSSRTHMDSLPTSPRSGGATPTDSVERSLSPREGSGGRPSGDSGRRGDEAPGRRGDEAPGRRSARENPTTKSSERKLEREAHKGSNSMREGTNKRRHISIEDQRDESDVKKDSAEQTGQGKYEKVSELRLVDVVLRVQSEYQMKVNSEMECPCVASAGSREGCIVCELKRRRMRHEAMAQRLKLRTRARMERQRRRAALERSFTWPRRLARHRAELLREKERCGFMEALEMLYEGTLDDDNETKSKSADSKAAESKSADSKAAESKSKSAKRRSVTPSPSPPLRSEDSSPMKRSRSRFSVFSSKFSKKHKGEQLKNSASSRSHPETGKSAAPNDAKKGKRSSRLKSMFKRKKHTDK